jgi:hypothetical protein
MENLLVHAWPVGTVQVIIGSVFEPASTSLEETNLSCFMVVAWAVRPEVGGSVILKP